MRQVDSEALMLARLEVARDIYGHYAELSEKCWVVSIAAGAAGVVAAVASARHARHWEQIMREIEHDLLLLRLERRMARAAG